MEALLAATARILVRDGYDRASTNKIAQMAGVSIGSLYQYFPSKEALVAELVDRHAERQFAVLAEKMAVVVEAPLPVAVRELVNALVLAHRLEPKLHKVLSEQVPRLGRAKKILELERRATELLLLNLERRRREIKPVSLGHAAFVIVHAVDAIAHAAVLDRPEYLEDTQLTDEVTALVVRYLVGGDAPHGAR